MESAIGLLERFQKEIPEMQAQLLDQEDLTAKVDDLTTAVDAMSATVEMLDLEEKVCSLWLLTPRPFTLGFFSGDHSDGVMETVVDFVGSRSVDGSAVATGGPCQRRRCMGSLVARCSSEGSPRNCSHDKSGNILGVAAIAVLVGSCSVPGSHTQVDVGLQTSSYGQHYATQCSARTTMAPAGEGDC